METNKTILCVDDHEETAELLKVMFEQTGFEVTSCSTAEECLARLETDQASALILDYRLPDRDGPEVCQEVRALHPKLPIIFFTGQVEPESRWQGLTAGANNYLIKPNDLDKIVPLVTQLIDQA